ncbi:uncharacterized protein LOC130613060 [Hydractinia symbiolongicarpus]|uniref:uncharacterized protein LOC130613060 n=1 Tax=Hydractinia symbiolongicarpus TaxID=13093 RepID=UPI00254FE7A5|nr:uncharacterized protein LOC130613060 [Hydractinia symbiolongicarpus]
MFSVSALREKFETKSKVNGFNNANTTYTLCPEQKRERPFLYKKYMEDDSLDAIRVYTKKEDESSELTNKYDRLYNASSLYNSSAKQPSYSGFVNETTHPGCEKVDSAVSNLETEETDFFEEKSKSLAKENKPNDTLETLYLQANNKASRSPYFNKRIYESRKRLYDNYMKQKEQLSDLRQSASRVLGNIGEFRKRYEKDETSFSDYALKSEIKAKQNKHLYLNQMENAGFNYDTFVQIQLEEGEKSINGKRMKESIFTSKENMQDEEEKSITKTVDESDLKKTGEESATEQNFSVKNLRDYWNDRLSPRRTSSRISNGKESATKVQEKRPVARASSFSEKKSQVTGRSFQDSSFKAKKTQAELLNISLDSAKEEKARLKLHQSTPLFKTHPSWFIKGTQVKLNRPTSVLTPKKEKVTSTPIKKTTPRRSPSPRLAVAKSKALQLEPRNFKKVLKKFGRGKFDYDIHGRQILITQNGAAIPTRYLDSSMLHDLTFSLDDYVAKHYDWRMERYALNQRQSWSSLYLPSDYEYLRASEKERLRLKAEEKIQQQLAEGMFKYAEQQYGKKRHQISEKKGHTTEEFEFYLQAVKAQVKEATDKLNDLLKKKKEIDAKVTAAEREQRIQQEKLRNAEIEIEKAIIAERNPILPKDLIFRHITPEWLYKQKENDKRLAYVPAFGCHLKNTKETGGIRNTAPKKSELTKKKRKAEKF